MSPWVAGLVLLSAVFHASWNAIRKGGGGRLRSVTVMTLAASAASAVWVAFLPVWSWRRQGSGGRLRLDAESLRSAAGGVVSLAAYAIVIWAASISPMGPVSALRESSVVVAAVLGWLFLGEQLGPWRLTACLVVASGAACIGLRG